jgi:hypothetical protein
VRRIIEARTLIDDAAGAPLPAECQGVHSALFVLLGLKQSMSLMLQVDCDVFFALAQARIHGVWLK